MIVTIAAPEHVKWRVESSLKLKMLFEINEYSYASNILLVAMYRAHRHTHTWPGNQTISFINNRSVYIIPTSRRRIAHSENPLYTTRWSSVYIRTSKDVQGFAINCTTSVASSRSLLLKWRIIFWHQNYGIFTISCLLALHLCHI